MTLHLDLSMAPNSASASTEEKSSHDTNHTTVSSSQNSLGHRSQQRIKVTLSYKNVPQTTKTAQANAQLNFSGQQQGPKYDDKTNCEVTQNDDKQRTKCKADANGPESQSSCFGKRLASTNQPTSSAVQMDNGEKNGRSSPTSSIEMRTSSTPLPTLENEFINILLLGESGVGKSTFINAFINYLTFETLEEALSKTPVALIPVSFLMTTGDNFAEHPVKLDIPDKLNNEDFKHPGQSVTQRCRSYVFHLERYGEKKLRIIDTPGFGDTRGLAQDDFNMQHSLEYINNLPHINAVCFLVKPNESRLNIFFRTCLAQLLDFLGSNIRQNIIFCFTNARPTFYAPGNTAPLLKNMLESIPEVQIPFQKRNVYCFDSESFRYLVAVKGGIAFTDQQKCEYETSWSKSVTELYRLLDCISHNPSVFRMHDDWKSVKHAQLEISHMIWPILETMRNCLRNIILCDRFSAKRSITMKPTPIRSPITMCLSKKVELYQIAYFWFLCNYQDDIKGSNHHVVNDYILDYDTSNDKSSLNKNDLSNDVSLLIDTCATFSSFLTHYAVVPSADPFLEGLMRMLDEEKYICTQVERTNWNERLSEELQILINNYRDRLDRVKQNEKYKELETIYTSIKVVRDFPEVSTQLAAVKRTQEYIIEQYEYEVPSDRKNVSPFEALIF